MDQISDKSHKEAQSEKTASTEKLHSEAYESRANAMPPGIALSEQTKLTLGKSNLLLQKDPASIEALPESKMERSRIVLGEAASALLPAVKDAWLGVDHIKIPMSEHLFGKQEYLPVPKILESAAVGTAIGFTARTLLPQAGILGKVGSVALATYFTAPLAKQSYDIYRGISGANSVADLRESGTKFGTIVGGFMASLPIGIASYKAGVYASDKLLSTEALAPFVAGKKAVFDAANDWTANKIDETADWATRVLVGEKQYTGSHSVAEQYDRISHSLEEGIKGTDYKLPTVKLDPSVGKDVNVLVVTGHGVEAPEFTEVVKAAKQAGANVTVATPDWTWKYQPGNEGKVTLAQWLDNKHTLQADISVSQGAEMMKAGKFDVMYVPGGAGNTAAIRTDAGVQALLRQSINQQLDTWTICHGGQVFISALEKGTGIKLTGSGDITAQDLPNAGFIVPKDPVVFDAAHKILSGQDPSVLDPYITAMGERFKAIHAAKAGSVPGAVLTEKPAMLTPPSIKGYPSDLGGGVVVPGQPAQVEFPADASTNNPNYPDGLGGPKHYESGPQAAGYPSNLGH